jgi:chromate transporter
VTPGRLELTRTFFRIGATSYGGPAIVAQIRKVTVQDKHWLSEEEFRESLAFAQMLPGPIATQTAAHIGWRLHRGIGVLLAMLAYNSPAFLLMLGLSAAYFHFERLPLVHTAFRGLGAAVVGIVVQSILSMAQPALRNWRGIVIAGLAAWGFFAGANTLLVLLAAAACGVAACALWPGTDPACADNAAESPERQPAGKQRRTFFSVCAVALVYAAAIAASRFVAPVLPALGLSMTKINLVAFGGGYTAVAFMYQEAVHNVAHAWLSPKEFIDGLALGQITPGPVIITATFIGYKVAGAIGSLFATICIFLPSSLLLTLMAPHFARLRHLRVVQSAVSGLLAAFIAMLLHVLAQVAKSAFLGPWDIALAVAAVVALRLRVDVLWVVLGAVALSLLLFR